MNSIKSYNMLNTQILMETNVYYNFSFDESCILSSTIQEFNNNFIKFSIMVDSKTGEILPIEKLLKYINKKEKGDLLINQCILNNEPNFVTNNNNSNLELIYTLILKNFIFTGIKDLLSHEIFKLNAIYSKYISVTYEYDKIVFLKNDKIEQRVNKMNEILGDDDIKPWYIINKDIIKS